MRSVCDQVWFYPYLPAKGYSLAPWEAVDLVMPEPADRGREIGGVIIERVVEGVIIGRLIAGDDMFFVYRILFASLGPPVPFGAILEEALK